MVPVGHIRGKYGETTLNLAFQFFPSGAGLCLFSFVFGLLDLRLTFQDDFRLLYFSLNLGAFFSDFRLREAGLVSGDGWEAELGLFIAEIVLWTVVDEEGDHLWALAGGSEEHQGCKIL